MHTALKLLLELVNTFEFENITEVSTACVSVLFPQLGYIFDKQLIANEFVITLVQFVHITSLILISFSLLYFVSVFGVILKIHNPRLSESSK